MHCRRAVPVGEIVHSQCVADAIPVGVCPDGALVSQPVTLHSES